MTERDSRRLYYVSVHHNLIQETRNESGEFEVWLNEEELAELRERLQAMEGGDEYAFRRAFVPYKSADRDDAIATFDDRTLSLYHYLRDHGSDETKRLIDGMDVLPKLEHTGYRDPGYGEDGSPTNK